MPRHTSPPKYRRHATGQAFVVIDGKHHYLGKHGTKESKEKYARLIAELSVTPAPAVADNDLTMVELLAAYLDHAEGYYRESREILKIKPVLREVLALYGSTLPNDFGPICLKALQRKWTEAGIVRKSVNERSRCVKRMFRWAVSEELLPGACYQALASVEGLRKGFCEAREGKSVRPVEDSVVTATLPYLQPVVADMVKLQRLCGCRPGELCIMRPRDLDRTGEVWQYKPATHKGSHVGKERPFHGPRRDHR